ncbi:YwqH-like family protein [Fictibacillus gelatini]|uniref:YwqH-like family protein n=1 Tax=Fictibacillus gelatini TaxID=225985 RepID=UPI000418612C|nr:DUF5082 family protein [Fictibacillus gelatini]
MRLEPVAPLSTEIAKLNVSLQSANVHVQKKQEELKRLLACQKKLTECEKDFEQNDNLCLKPELGSKTWCGNIAESFEAIREKNVQSNYRDLLNVQLDQALEQLKHHIEVVQTDIHLTLQTISSQQSQLSELKEQQRKERHS